MDKTTISLTLTPEQIEKIAFFTETMPYDEKSLTESVLEYINNDDKLEFFVRQEAKFRLHQDYMDGYNASNNEIGIAADALLMKSEQWIDSDKVCSIIQTAMDE